jgi:hypothetical protein
MISNTLILIQDTESIQCFCKDGYKGDGYTKCDDVNECYKDNNLCTDPKKKCTNTVGSYECTCRHDFLEDENGECILNICKSKKCAKNGECVINNGEPTCECIEGYVGYAIKSCFDLNECSTGQHDCSPRAKCSNAKGSFTCACLEGYEGDGKECLAPAEIIEKQILADREALLFSAEGRKTHIKNTFISL